MHPSFMRFVQRLFFGIAFVTLTNAGGTVAYAQNSTKGTYWWKFEHKPEAEVKAQKQPLFRTLPQSFWTWGG